jgi:hypothetical protein
LTIGLSLRFIRSRHLALQRFQRGCLLGEQSLPPGARAPRGRSSTELVLRRFLPARR